MSERKVVWRSLQNEEAGKHVIIEEEEVKEILSLSEEDSEKGKTSPLLSRTVASTNVSTVNTSQGAETGGPDYSHIANSFKAGPKSIVKHPSFVSKYFSNVVKEGIKKITSRSLARGR